METFNQFGKSRQYGHTTPTAMLQAAEGLAARLRLLEAGLGVIEIAESNAARRAAFDLLAALAEIDNGINGEFESIPYAAIGTFTAYPAHDNMTIREFDSLFKPDTYTTPSQYARTMREAAKYLYDGLPGGHSRAMPVLSAAPGNALFHIDNQHHAAAVDLLVVLTRSIRLFSWNLPQLVEMGRRGND